MEKNQDEALPPMNQHDYIAMSQQLKQNKEELIRILQQNPKVGAYLGETHDDWDNFYTFYINFLKSQIGPRGECAKLVREELLKIQHEVNQVLLPFGQTARTHIRDIYMKHKFFVPCEEYPLLLKIQEANGKFKSNLERLKDPNSPMRKQITEGLITKHGQEYNFEEEFNKLQQNYESKIEQGEKEIERLREVLNKTEKYHEYMKVKQVLEPYFKIWVQADSGMGRQNVKTGQAFEDKVNAEMLPYLIAREKSDKKWLYSDKKFQIFTNASWIPKNLGEIDIAFGYKDENLDRYFIFTLIQCKSRLFDLREACKQVSLDDQEPLNKGPTLQELKEMKRNKQLALASRKSKKQKNTQNNEQAQITGEKKEQKKQEIIQEKKEEEVNKKPNEVVFNKKFLSTKYGPAELVEDHHFYIVTTLPQNDFVLPIQSKMKEAIEKYSKNKFIEDLQSEPLYQCTRQVFSAVMSPLDWIKNYEQKCKGQQSNILVLR